MQIKKAIILLHGYATDKYDLMSIKDELEKRYDYVHLENLPGHGDESIKEFNAIDTIIYCREQCMKLFKEYYVVDILGFSMGGAIATYLATQFEFNHIILLAPANKYLNLNTGFSRINILFEYLSKSKDNLQNKENIERKFDYVVKNDKKSFDIALKQLLPNYTLHSLRAFRTIIDYCDYNLKNKVINTKTLLIWGSVDQLVPKKVIKFLLPHFPNMEVNIMDGISHLMLRSENYNDINQIILNFIDNN